MSFLNFRIRGRLYSGFAILLVFCAELAAFGGRRHRGRALARGTDQ
jgi:hypothetical protein